MVSCAEEALGPNSISTESIYFSAAVKRLFVTLTSVVSVL